MITSKHSYEDNLEIEEAIKFLVREIEKHCNNTKPLITHCIRVAIRLDIYGYKKEIVQAALLHDLLEDTKANINDIEEKFGKYVARLVLASTFDIKIENKVERYKASFNEALNLGNDALVIRASDILENSYYYSLVEDKDLYNHLLAKLSYFLKLAQPKIGSEKIFKELKARLNTLKKQ